MVSATTASPGRSSTYLKTNWSALFCPCWGMSQFHRISVPFGVALTSATGAGGAPPASFTVPPSGDSLAVGPAVGSEGPPT